MYRCIHFVHERFHANENYSLKLMVVGHRWTQINTDSPSTGLRIWPRITRICTKRMDTDGPSTPAWCGTGSLRIWPRITRICTKRMDTDGPSTPAWCGTGSHRIWARIPSYLHHLFTTTNSNSF
jgi:hypothetical protein